MSTAINPEFHGKVNARLDRMIASFYEAAPAARHLASASAVDETLYLRHTIETILRMRMARIADGAVISAFAKTDRVAAQRWARYADDEMLHDTFFLKDLNHLAVTEDTVGATEPLVATKLLQGYLYYTLAHEGPRGVLTKSYFLEYTTRKTQGAWNANVKKSFGDRAVSGADAHLKLDVAEDHSTDVWNTLMRVVATPADEALVLDHIEVYYGLFLAYFNELARLSKPDLARAPQDVIAGAFCQDRPHAAE